MKNRFLIMSFVFLLIILSGCTLKDTANDKKYTAEELQMLAKLEIYSVNDNLLLHTIEDQDILFRFNSLDILYALESDKDINDIDLENHNPLYRIVAYKFPAAKINDGSLIENLTITVYEGTNIAKMQAPPGTIKNFPTPAEFLGFYSELSKEDKDFLVSLAT